MKQCPKCSKTYANDKQKFCTKDGTALVDEHQASAGQDATIRIDSTQLDDEITKVISQPLPRMSDERFDPYKTNVSTPQEPAPPPSQPIAPPPTAPAPPVPPPPPVPSEPPPVAPPPPVIPAPSVAPPPPSLAPESPDPGLSSSRPAAVSTSAVQLPTIALSMPESPAAPWAATAQPAPPVAPKKRSKLPIVLGILFVLLLIGAGGAVAGYFLVLKPILEKRSITVIEPRRPEPAPIAESTPNIGSTKPESPKIEVPPYSPPADAVQFVNSSAKLDGKLAEHYVDFSFYYPKTWQKDPKAGGPGASNFAKVERRLPPDFTQENFAVGWYSSTGSTAGDSAVFPTLAQNLSAQFAKSFPSEYKKVSEGSTKAGVYDGYEFRFESVSRKTEHGDLKIWGRVIFVPPVDGSSNGVTLLMLTTSLATELKSVEDVGVKGELPMMLASFRFGK